MLGGRKYGYCGLLFAVRKDTERFFLVHLAKIGVFEDCGIDTRNRCKSC